MLKKKTDSTIRPYWHVDAKWVCAILLTLGLWVSSVLYILSTLTSERIAVPVATQIVAGLFSNKGLDDTTEIEEFKQKARQQAGDKVETLPGIFVSKTDIETLSPRELRLKIFGQLVTPYYELGAKGVAAKQTTDPAERAKIERQAGLLALLNKNTHEILEQAFLISLGLLVLPLIGLVYFSAGFGRLVSPGIVLISISFPGAVIAGIMQIAKHSSKPFGGGGTSAIPALPPESLEMMLGAFTPVFALVFALGVLLLVAAGIGKAVSKRQHIQFDA